MRNVTKDSRAALPFVAVFLGVLGGANYAAWAQGGPAGCWAGSAGTGADQRRIVLELVREEGAWSARLHRLSREIRSDTMAATISEKKLVFMGKEGTFTGEIAADEATILGTLEREGKKHPVSLVRASDVGAAAREKLLGFWAGALEQNGISVLRIVMKFRPAPCGQITALMDSPDQGASDMPVTSLDVSRDSVHFELSYAGGRYAGIIGTEQGKMVGRWFQSGVEFKLDLVRSDSPPTSRRPQEPEKPYPYREEEVRYENPAQGVKIAGTLTLPEGDGPFPAVLLLSGSGAQNRDEALLGHRPFLVIADRLTRRGIAVLRVDDRGIGGSTGNLFAATLEDNASDALAGVEFLRSRPEIGAGKIGLLGHSEGGWVAPIAALRSPDVSFIVMLAGPAVNGEELLLAQSEALQRGRGVSAEILAAEREISKRMYTILKTDLAHSTAEQRLRQELTQVQPELLAAQRSPQDSVVIQAWTGQLEQQLQLLTTPWFRFLLAYDPAPVLAKVQVPILALYGELDLQVPVEQSVAAMEAALRLRKDHDHEVRAFPGLNHLFQHATTGGIEEYARSEETIAPEVLQLIGTWILERTH